MSFFSKEDRALRESKKFVPPTREEVEAYSKAQAHENLQGVLDSIKESYRGDSRGISFSYDSAPFQGSRSNADPRLNNQIMVEELVRLVENKTGLSCELHEGNGPVKSGFRIAFED